MVGYLDRLRRIGASERVIEGERDGWILLAARWPDRVREVMPAKIGYLDDPRIVRLYRLLSDVFEPGADDSRLEEVADLMAELNEQAYGDGENLDDTRLDDLAFDLLEAFAVESDPRTQRLMELMQDRGWSGWIRLEKSPG